MKTVEEIITSGNLAFLKIMNVELFKSKEHHKVFIESFEKELSDRKARLDQICVWESDQIPPDCAAIVILRPENVARLKEAHEKLERLRQFAAKPVKATQRKK